MDKINHDFIDYLVSNLSQKIINISSLSNGSYNNVYKIEAEKNTYVLRIFASKSWPEKGKPEFINRQLKLRNIKHADMILLERDGGFYPYGFMLEEFISGYNVEDIIGSKLSYEEYYGKLARCMRQVHEVKIKKCGYIGTGSGSHASMVDFMDYECARSKEELLKRGLFNAGKLDEYIHKAMTGLGECSDLPFVLCHSDISEDNVMLDSSNKLVLIDWDNAVSSYWVSDFSLMTYWMHFRYKRDDYEKYKDIFLNEYASDIDRNKLVSIERTYHLIQSLKLLGYYNDEANIHRVMNYLSEINQMI